MRISNSERKLHRYNLMMIHWINNLNSGRRIGDYLKRKGINDIAIFGYGDIGRILVNELIEDGINIKYCVDKNEVSSQISIRKIEDINEDMQLDAMIVTAIIDYGKIREKINDKYKLIISLEDLIYEMSI